MCLITSYKTLFIYNLEFVIHKVAYSLIQIAFLIWLRVLIHVPRRSSTIQPWTQLLRGHQYQSMTLALIPGTTFSMWKLVSAQGGQDQQKYPQLQASASVQRLRGAKCQQWIGDWETTHWKTESLIIANPGCPGKHSINAQIKLGTPGIHRF